MHHRLLVLRSIRQHGSSMLWGHFKQRNHNKTLRNVKKVLANRSLTGFSYIDYENWNKTYTHHACRSTSFSRTQDKLLPFVQLLWKFPSLAVDVKHFLIYKNDFVLNVMQSDVTSVSLKMMTHTAYIYHANFSQSISVLAQFLCGNSNLA